MAATLQLDASGFRRALAGLGRFTGAELKDVIRAATASILKACAGDTPVATQQQADTRSRKRAVRDLGFTGGRNNREADISVNAGVRGPYGRVFKRKRDGTGWRRTHEAGFRPLWQHYKRGDWIDLQEAVASVKSAVARALPMGRAAVGLARQSWVQIADDLGIALEAVPGGRISAAGIAKARAALASNGRAYDNGQAREYGEARAFFVEIINRLPYGRKIALDQILVKNVNARARFFEQNLSRGVFDRLASATRAYPGLEIRRAA